MKVYLDDERDTPDGWERAHSAQEAIDLLRTGRVQQISLDHDLGDNTNGTGYDVICWIEWAQHERVIHAPIIWIHTGNVVGRKRMEQVLERIERGRDE